MRKQRGTSLIGLPAILPNLPIGSSERFDISHLDDGADKVRTEGVVAVAVGAHYGISGPTIEQLLIRVEEAFVLDEVLEVVVVKGSRGLKIKWGQVVVPRARGSWAV